MKLLIDGKEYEVGIDSGRGRDVVVEEHFLKPSAEYPDGSYMRKVGGEVEIATGFYSLKYPDKPSLYFHKGTPYFFFDLPSRIHTPEPETEKD
jgi:hypothetical protein